MNIELLMVFLNHLYYGKENDFFFHVNAIVIARMIENSGEGNSHVQQIILYLAGIARVHQ